MALTQQQWFTKLRGWVPSWWFEQEKYGTALFQAAAGLFSDLQQQAEDHLNATYIAQATSPILDAHGAERSLVRLSGESDLTYATRVRYYVSQSDKASIKALVDSLLIRGTCTILEGFQDLPFCNRGSFMSRKEYLTGYHINFFTIVVDAQATQSKNGPFSFLSRGYYASRGNYISNNRDVSAVYAAIVAAVNQAKALGVLYRIVER